MIINNQQSDVTTFGDVKEFKTSIDPKNLNFITTLLSSNLYSNPEASFLRETVSNAWDSHVEAGTTDTPVIIKMSNQEISIRDFGTGLSPERFEEIYCNIGSSTKRESNDFIGGFGLGRFAALACSNTVFITSFYNGKAWYYVMVKDGNAITIHLVNEENTEEKNGVLVSIKTPHNLTKYYQSLKYLTFFPNIYIHSGNNSYDIYIPSKNNSYSIINAINQSKIKKFDNYAVTSVSLEFNHILLGNVLYPEDKTLLSQEANDFMRELIYTGIAIRFNIGELEVTPNRESIIYSQSTIEKLNKKILEVKKEIESKALALIKKDFDDLYEYVQYKKSTLSYDPLNEEIKVGYFSNMYRCILPRDREGITYKGKDIDALIPQKDYFVNNSPANAFFFLQVPFLRGIYRKDGMGFTTNPPEVALRNCTFKAEKFVVLKNIKVFSYIAKDYIGEHWRGYPCINEISKEDFFNYLENSIAVLKSNISGAQEYKQILYDYFLSKCVVFDANSKEFLEYKEERKKEAKSENKTPIVQKIILYSYDDIKTTLNFDTIEEVKSYLLRNKEGVLLGEMSEDSYVWKQICNFFKIRYIQASKPVLKLIKEQNLSCIVTKDFFINNTKMPFYKAIISHFMTKLTMDQSSLLISEFINTPCHEKRVKYKEIWDTYKRMRNNSSLITFIEGITSIKPDSSTIKLCEEFFKNYNSYIEIRRAFERDASFLSNIDSLLVSKIIMKDKKYRINNSCYDKIKKNKILRVLCAK